MMLLGTGVLAITYAVPLVFYLFSWSVVGPAGIEEHLPWGRRSYSFDQIAFLETIPSGMHSSKVPGDGPWYFVRFVDGRTFGFGDEEGCSEADFSTIATFIAGQSGQAWRVRPDAQPHDVPASSLETFSRRGKDGGRERSMIKGQEGARP
jgi:hypothetical protein